MKNHHQHLIPIIHHQLRSNERHRRSLLWRPAKAARCSDFWLQKPIKNGEFHYRMGPPFDSVQLPQKSGWILWFMVDLAIVFMGVLLWFINQLVTGGPHPVQDGAPKPYVNVGFSSPWILLRYIISTITIVKAQQYFNWTLSWGPHPVAKMVIYLLKLCWCSIVLCNVLLVYQRFFDDSRTIRVVEIVPETPEIWC